MSKLHSCVLGPGYTMNVAITSYYVGSNTFKSVQPIRKVTKSDKVWGLCRASLLWSCPSQMVAAGHLSHLRKFGEDETDLNGSWFSLPSPGMFATCMLGAHRQDKSLKPFWIRVSMDIFEHLPLPGFVVRIKVFYCGRKMSKGDTITRDTHGTTSLWPVRSINMSIIFYFFNNVSIQTCRTRTCLFYVLENCTLKLWRSMLLDSQLSPWCVWACCASLLRLDPSMSQARCGHRYSHWESRPVAVAVGLLFWTSRSNRTATSSSCSKFPTMRPWGICTSSKIYISRSAALSH